MTKPLTDVGLLLTSSVLSIGSLLFVTLLIISYISKKKHETVRNKLYRNMLIVILIMIITELLEIFLLLYSSNKIILLVTYKVHWSTGIIWFSFLYYYSIVFMDNIESDSLYEVASYNKKTYWTTMFFILSFIIYLALPFDLSLMKKPYMTFFPGAATYCVYVFCFLTEAIFITHLIMNRKKVEKRKRLAIWIMLVELLVIFALQVLFKYIAFLEIGATIQMFFLYFNIENPDLAMIKELEKVNSDIDRSSKAKSDFLSNMSHEIRTPMNAIVGFSESLINSKKFDSENAKSDIQHISSAGNNLLDIVNNILDISKIESGKETLEMKEYSLGNIVMELSSIINARLGNKDVKLIVDVDSKIPSKLYGDPTKILQVLLNILTNAVKYTEVGKIKLIITGESKGLYETLHIKVTDTGYGIKKEDYDKLFEKFSRLESATQNEIEGTGLGLVITKKYVDLMGGKIWFESEYEVGTTFYVDLNQKIISKKGIGDINEGIVDNKEDDSYMDCSGYKILIVDDNELNLKVASRLLSKYGFSIETVTNAKDCINNVKMEKHYDMIFLDHMMPEMDGIEAIHILRKLEDYQLPPIIALTANAITGMKEMYLSEGFDEYLSKPINIAELNKIINKYFFQNK